MRRILAAAAISLCTILPLIGEAPAIAAETTTDFATIGGWSITRSKFGSAEDRCQAIFSDTENMLLVRAVPSQDSVIVAFSTHEVTEAPLAAQLDVRSIFLPKAGNGEETMAGPAYVDEGMSENADARLIWHIPAQPSAFVDLVSKSALISFYKAPLKQLMVMKYDSGGEAMAALRRCEATLK